MSAFPIHAKITGDKAEKADRWAWGKRIRDVAQAPDGSIWVIEDGAKSALVRLTPGSPRGGPVRLPRAGVPAAPRDARAVPRRARWSGSGG